MAKSKLNKKINREEKKIKITFIDDVKIFDHNNEVSFEAKRGGVVSMVGSSANYHITRDMAIEGDHAEAIAAEDAELEKAEGAEEKAFIDKVKTVVAGG